MRTTTFIILALVLLLPGLATATVTCTAVDNGGGAITVTISTTDADFISIGQLVLVNAQLDAQTCKPLGGNNPCTLDISQLAAGPSSSTLPVTDLDGTVDCAFDNDDGLPVELVEVSVE